METNETPKASEIKSWVMGVCIISITVTLCSILATYAFFSMYHNKELSENQLKLFAGLAFGLNDILVMFFTAAILKERK